MKNSKSTKRALLGSAISLVLCFAMFLGTTFAWFTDSEVTAGNVITSGNLDIKVEYTLDGENWADLDGAQDMFQKGLWEPGHTEVVALKIKNNGSLALKYTANMNIIDEAVGKNKDGGDIVLSDILNTSTLTIEDAGVDPVFGKNIAEKTLEMAFRGENEIAWGATSTFKAGNVLESDMQLFAGSTHYVFVKVDMPETVGNEANHDGKNIPAIDFGINVLATQFTYEEDSFGKDYDKDASVDGVVTYFKKDDIVLLENTTESITVKKQEEVNIKLNDKVLENSIVNNGKTTISNGTIETGGAGLDNFGIATVNNIKMEAGSPSDYSNRTSGIGAETTYNNVDIVSGGGGIGAQGGANVVFNSGIIALNSTSTSGRYLFYAVGEGTVITINGGEFSFSKTLNQKRAYIYAGDGVVVYVTGGNFGPASARSGYTAGILGSGKVIITGGTFGFDPSAWVAEGYTATKANGIWTVSAVANS